MTSQPFTSIAIAGAWGYIGLHFLRAARTLGLRTTVFDPGPPPPELDLSDVELASDEAAFYSRQADLFHLALHPEHRDRGLSTLLARSHREPISVLCEKPMAEPDRPERCDEIIEAVDRSRAVVLYDFPELFDPITWRILDVLRSHRDVFIRSIYVQRSKDREDPANPRNRKRMVTIQYQESVHCLAFAIYLLGAIQPMEEALGRGMIVEAKAVGYTPPNPEDYPHSVDGRCDFHIQLSSSRGAGGAGGTVIEGRTDFTRGAPWAKTRRIEALADGRPLTIDAEYLEGHKRLVINGQPHDDVTETNSYAEVIKTFGRWRCDVARGEMMTGHYPNPRFARLAYRLSSALWRASRAQSPLRIESLAALESFDAGYAP